jgi:hypothetical protein
MPEHDKVLDAATLASGLSIPLSEEYSSAVFELTAE